MRKMVLTWLLFTLFLAAESGERAKNAGLPGQDADKPDIRWSKQRLCTQSPRQGSG
ncbi:hypothetical protein [Paenibacillus sp. 1P03SA]|uniref:hypothetical protein n=1 Tax=Paenibacillus sp. 1P03SA TaxID=3132294 RepID=UPI0039A39027